MASKKIGKATVKFTNPPFIIGTGTVVGPMEGKGPLAKGFDVVLPDLACGEKTPEKSERKLLEQAANIAIERSGVEKNMIDYYIAGDLLNQIISAGFSARQLAIPFFGVYGACSTCAMGATLGSMIIDGGFSDYILIGCSSHYQAAERQFRHPIELNVKHKAISQYTVTGAGALVLSSSGKGPRLTWATTGKVIDLGIKDPCNLGAAMAPAAADTFVRYMIDTGSTPDMFDLVLTGDLGNLGSELFKELVKDAGYAVGNNYNDCGLMIFDTKTQQVGAGGSGCACPAVVMLGPIFGKLEDGTLKKVLLVATGALLSPLSSQQGETIPGIGHIIVIEA